MNVADIEAEARAEIEAEDRRAAIDAAKVRIREHDARPLWKRLFPFTIKIERDA